MFAGRHPEVEGFSRHPQLSDAFRAAARCDYCRRITILLCGRNFFAASIALPMDWM